MRVAIIGAGAAGLASARHVIDKGLECEVFELAPALGGTWLYTDNVGTDDYGFPIYSPMYKGLRTNLPKQVMEFPDFPIQNDSCYLSQEQILEFLNSYADRFKLRSSIKFNTHVVNVKPIDENKWLVETIHKPTLTSSQQVFDGVMICNGHYNDPVCPNLKGQEKFQGVQCHSHTYRSPERFTGQRVLVVGAGPSGLDLTLQISRVASKVVLSHHVKDHISTCYPSNVELRPDIEEVIDHETVQFVDGSRRSFDVIFYCTGYRYSFPFLDKSCGISIVENHIEPLYKHMIDIRHPTMCLIGIPFNVCAFQMFDLQARYFVAYLNGSMALPTEDEMFKDLEDDMRQRYAKGYTKRQAHLLGPDQYSYYQDLAAAADTKPIPPVIVKLRDESVKRLYDDLINFREDRYEVVDEENFIRM